MQSDVLIRQADSGFREWGHLLALLHDAFAYQKDRIDPPSSLYRLNETTLAEKAGQECLFLAKLGTEIVGCVFAKPSPVSTYLGKLAVRPDLQGKGIGRKLIEAVEKLALLEGSPLIELETRIELVENHETFEKLGFVKISEGAHEGYERPTFIRMQKRLGRLIG